MPTTKPALRLTRDQVRRVCVAAQGLSQPARSPVEALQETGFVRTLGGVDVYIAVRARVPGLRRDDLDGVVAEHRAQVIPAARGCMYLVARRDVPISLRVAALLSRARDERDQEKAGIRPGETEEVAKAALETLRAKGPLTTDGLRKALPAGTVRSLGEQGKKVGVSSPLPGALRKLEFDGLVERTLENRRLDSERYLWRAAAASPFDGVSLPDDPIDLYAGMARIFFHAAGLATLKDFAGWIGIAQRDAKAALERLGFLPVEVEGNADVHYLPEDRRNLLDEAADAVALLSFEDNLIHLHGGPAFLVDEEHHGAQVPSWGMGRPSTLGEAKHLTLRSFVADGKIAGFWEYDPDARAIVVRPFGPLSKATRARVDEAAADLGRFLTEDLGHGRSFSLDTDEELRKRTAKVREAGA
ncbi:MAG: crosslink repair DNA glycosylase YcaQ family protein [Acidobacteriota bacterium]